MKDVIIFEDGKGARGSRAKLIKRGNKRVLIQFEEYNWEDKVEVTVTRWFKLFTRHSTIKYNNKRNKALYQDTYTNEFYSDYWQTVEYKNEVKGYFTPEYYTKLFGE
jgi:hypothetical protein